MSFPDIADSFQPRLPPMGPFIPGGSASGSMSRAKFVDPDTTVAHADQNGSDEAPYATIAQAVEALGLVGGGVVLLNPGQYPAENITPSVFIPITLRGLSFADAAPCDLTNITLNNQESVAIVDVFAFGNCTYRNSLYIENSNVGQCVFDAETPSGNATLRNSTAQQIECDTGRATDCSIQFFFNTSSCFLTRSNVSVQLTCGGNLVLEGTPVQGSIPATTAVDLTVTAVGYQLADLTCFRYQWLESCQLSGNCVVTSPEAMPMKNCTFSNGVNIDGPAGATLEMDSNTYGEFFRKGGTVSGGIDLIVVDSGQATARVSIVVPALATDEMGFATVSLVGTPLDGILPNTPICVTTTQDLSAAGAGRGGVLGSPRIVAANTLKVSFAGALAGGASDILVTMLGPPL